MSQSGITEPARERDWDTWYMEHLKIMLTVPGVMSAQRFKSDTPLAPPSLGLYSIASAGVFTDAYYQSVRGMGEWLPLIDRRYYRRNLFEGLATAQAVALDQLLLIADRAQPMGNLTNASWVWLECVGIDRSTPYRGMAVVDASSAARLGTDDIAVYKPVTACLTPQTPA